jgi:hypothetical protein
MVTTENNSVGRSLSRFGRAETPVTDGIVVTERSDRVFVTTVHQSGQLDGWSIESESFGSAVKTHNLAVRLASQAADRFNSTN